MNTISVSNNPTKGILVDNSHSPMGLTLPSGECTLVFIAKMTDGSSPLGRTVALDFIDKRTRKGAVGLQIVKGEHNQWSNVSSQAANAEGEVQFSLRVPASLPDNLALLAVLTADAPYSDGKNSLTFNLSEAVVDNTVLVDKLEKVSGDKQFVQQGTGTVFAPLRVRASQGGIPIGSAKVTWRVTDVQGDSGTTVPPGPILTTGGGIADATPVAGRKSGLLSVTGMCNGHSVVFFLTVLPAWADLTLVSDSLYAVLPGQATHPWPVTVRLVTKTNEHEAWPGIPCTFYQVHSGGGVLIPEQLPAQGTRLETDQNGALPRFNVRFAVRPDSATPGTADYQAYLPGNDAQAVTANITLPLR